MPARQGAQHHRLSRGELLAESGVVAEQEVSDGVLAGSGDRRVQGVRLVATQVGLEVVDLSYRFVVAPAVMR